LPLCLVNLVWSHPCKCCIQCPREHSVRVEGVGSSAKKGILDQDLQITHYYERCIINNLIFRIDKRHTTTLISCTNNSHEVQHSKTLLQPMAPASFEIS
jgi:hypothetical protein